MLERNGVKLGLKGDGLGLSFRAFEIKTVRLHIRRE
jgi:hypothetical protein